MKKEYTARVVIAPKLTEAQQAAIGEPVRIRRGAVGEGYRFRIADFGVCGLGKPIVYGSGNYGPRWIDEVEALTDAGRAALRGVS